jgi:uncharacterized membrane protein/thiol-disulfide isomerase/thioredoxin
LAGLLGVPGFLSTAQAQTSVPAVRAVLFYSPTCPHCQYVITETLPPLMAEYGNQLQVFAVDVTQPDGQMLFLAALRKFGLEEGGVPFLVMDSVYLVGSQEIPEKLPALVETHLSRGGVDWPDIPGLREAISQSSEVGNSTAAAPPQSAPLQVTPMPATASVSPAAPRGFIPVDAHSADWIDNFARDPTGNTLAVLVLVGMLASIGGAVIFLGRAPGTLPTLRGSWLIPVLCLLGLGVAGYLTYVETAQVEAVCGPVGDCNTVQQSEYARLFGVLPIGVLGIVGYAMILLVWLFGEFSSRQIGRFKDLAIFGIATLGTLFSIYLTFLEPFVIGASCAWCLASSVIMTALFWLALPAGRKSILQD